VLTDGFKGNWVLQSTRGINPDSFACKIRRQERQNESVKRMSIISNKDPKIQAVS
jgi:hypothetical protein